MTQKLQKAAEWLAAIAEPTRMMILAHLSTGRSNVTDLATACNVEMVNISHHLGVLRSAGIVEAQKDGRFMHYSLVDGQTTKQGVRLAHESGIVVVVPVVG